MLREGKKAREGGGDRLRQFSFSSTVKKMGSEEKFALAWNDFQKNMVQSVVILKYS